MKKPAAIFIDIDNTLIPSGGGIEVSSANLKALQDLQKANIYVILATGRSEKDAIEINKKIRINGYGDYLIVANGSKIFGSELEVLNENFLSKKDFNSLIEYAKTNNYNIKFSNIDSIYNNFNKFNKVINNFYKRYQFTNYDQIAAEKFEKDNFAKIGFFFFKKEDAKRELSNLRQEFKHLEIALTGRGHYIEITNGCVNKAYGAQLLANLLNFNLKSAVAIGDSMNDFPLFEAVGFSVAMKNSMKNLLEVADYETLSAADDGVAYFINEKILF